VRSPATPLRRSPRPSSRQVAWSPAPAAGGAGTPERRGSEETPEGNPAGGPARTRAARSADLHSFARGLRHDYDAVRNGLTLPWNSGTVEGTVNKIKMIKRQMYGRAGFPLLRNRVLAL
jgi:hypothetical protein